MGGLRFYSFRKAVSLLKIFALCLFLLMYVLMVVLPHRRTWVALGAAVLFLASGMLPLRELPGAVNWNVLFMISGTMVIVHYFIDSKMPNRLADMLMTRSKNVKWVTVYLSVFAGLISAFIDNVATVLIMAPVGMAVCRKQGINPVPMILSIAVSSNLQGAATLVGDTTSIMLGDFAGMDFLSFFWMEGRPGIFFAVELGALASVGIMFFLFRKDTQPVTPGPLTPVKDWFPGIMLLAVIGCLIGASFVQNKPGVTNGLICLVLAAVTVLRDQARTRDGSRLREAGRAVDKATLLLLVGLFIVIAGVTNVGLVDDFAAWIVKVGGNNLFVLFTVITFGSVAISAFVDNIPYVATMLPVLAGVTSALGMEPYLLYFGLLSGATLGGNLTPFGASANVTAVGQLMKEDYIVSFKDFARIGVPFTLSAVCAGYLFLWFVWR